MTPSKLLMDAAPEIHRILVNEEERSIAIPAVLETLGRAAGLDRVSIFQSMADANNLQVLYQWEKGRLKSASFPSYRMHEVLPGLEARFLSGEDLKGSFLPGDHQEEIFLANRGMLAGLAFPIILRKKFWGLFLYESEQAREIWDEGLVSILECLSSTVGVSILRWESETQLQLINEELNAAAERARKLVIESERANAAKGEFLARMSHEIRTPMNGILGMARLLSYQEMPQDQREQLDIILQSGEMLLHIINDILDFSKIEAGKLLLNPVGFDLHSMLESVHGLLKLKAEEKRIGYLTEVADDVPHQLNGDSVRIRQILMNLIGNAVKFTSSGQVSVRTECLGEDANKVRIRFIISDTGPGIPEDRIRSLFEEFSQLDGSTVREFEGTGLGLAIVSRLLDLMNGDIAVESTVGEGSKFIVTLELEKRAGNVDGLLDENAEESLRGRRVLVVDDNENNLKIMGGLLDKWACRHTETNDPQVALRLLDEAHDAGDPYLCAIIDMMMPKWDGIQLAQRIRKQPELTETLLMVMLSSVDVRDQEVELRKAGFVSIMQKPVHAQQLHEVLISSLYQHERSKPAMLVVDDDEVLLECTKRIMQKEYEVFTAVSPQEAEKFLQGNHSIDLLFCDHHMPGETGLDFCKRLHASGSSVVPVLITGHVEPDFLLDAINSQALFRYLVKPVKQDLLLKTAREAMEEKRSRSRNKMKIALSETRVNAEGELPAPTGSGHQTAPKISKVLLAEDNPVNQKVAAQFLKRLGVECEIVSNGKLALVALTQHAFDAVIMDLHMPEMDGLEATRAYRALETAEQRPHLPIIALTADAIKGDREKCIDAGMDDYITKPLKLKALEDVLAKVLTIR
ncbi:response regulator [Kiritimatiellaeota bacterium B1221]|nr:response regulator [Kiritimatiellaeota bacterium B1221]